VTVGQIPAATAARIERELVGRYHLFVTAKTGAAWAGVGAAFDLVRALGVKNLPSGSDFNTRFGTSLGPVVILPDAPLSPAERVCLLAHEAEHARQFFAAPGEMPVRYLSIPEARGSHYEVPAYAITYALRWALTGTLPATPQDLPGALVWGYLLDEADLAHCQVALEQHATSISFGLIPEGPARVVLAILAAEAPDAFDPRALALIRANCPEALVLS
jgi:hypothetical protein